MVVLLLACTLCRLEPKYFWCRFAVKCVHYAFDCIKCDDEKKVHAADSFLAMDSFTFRNGKSIEATELFGFFFLFCYQGHHELCKTQVLDTGEIFFIEIVPCNSFSTKPHMMV